MKGIGETAVKARDLRQQRHKGRTPGRSSKSKRYNRTTLTIASSSTHQRAALQLHIIVSTGQGSPTGRQIG
ncbi:uncharacterized protein PG986_011802 [Apiospora aurea]|uniref:Uncharacterized protein n=1 Tax=Apiospora aurea TaxID=335848 RepID=A0ABR1PY61_9PEZI